MRNDPLSQSNYGNDLYRGDGVVLNRMEAIPWFQKSAIRGEPFAARVLAVAFRDGIAIPKSQQRARYWAMRTNFDKNDVVHNGKQNPIPGWALRTADRCDPANPRHADSGAALSSGVVAFQAEVWDTANCWLTVSASGGNIKAHVYLGIMNAFGMGAPPDAAAAGFEHMKKAAEAGDAYGMVYLANFYRYGIGTAADMDQGSAWMGKGVRSPGGIDAFLSVQGLLLTDKEIATNVLSSVVKHVEENPCFERREEYERQYGTPSPETCPDTALDPLLEGKANHTIETPQEIFPEAAPW